MTGPCGWVVEKCACGTCWDGYSPAVQQRAAATAALVMWAATGRRYGACQVTVMPLNPVPQPPLYQVFPVAGGAYGGGGDGTWMTPVLEAGRWRNLCNGGCSCGSVCEAVLEGPVVDVVEVVVDGVIVDPGAYEIHNGNLLVRKDGGCWPNCQVFGTQIPGFEVTYHRGRRIPPAVQYGLEMLACEMAAACVGGECRLPVGLQSLTRQGVTVQVESVESASSGRAHSNANRIRTRIPAVDAIIEADNPGSMSGPREIWSPDDPVRGTRVVTWAGGS